MSSMKLQFAKIWATGRWASDGVHRSGTGSSLEYTANLRAQLPRIIARHKIKSVFDAPCGDMTWMSKVSLGKGVVYLGADIVPEIVSELAAKYPGRRFKKFDITANRFPRAGLWLCRLCLNHLSNDDIAKAFVQLHRSRSSVRFVMFSSHPGAENGDVKTGGFRRLDLTRMPFKFGRPVETIEDSMPGFPRCQLLMWKVDDIRRRLRSFMQ